jgi:hypothetical protein
VSFPANLALAYLQISIKISICRFASRIICILAGGNCFLKTITPLTMVSLYFSTRDMLEASTTLIAFRIQIFTVNGRRGSPARALTKLNSTALDILDMLALKCMYFDAFTDGRCQLIQTMEP